VKVVSRKSLFRSSIRGNHYGQLYFTALFYIRRASTRGKVFEDLEVRRDLYAENMTIYIQICRIIFYQPIAIKIIK